jgi:hypothetical protein
MKELSKFTKFLSSLIAVMVLSVGLAAPMILRADDNNKELIKKTKAALLEEKERNDRKIKEADETIKKADEEIAKAKKKIEEAKKLCLNLNNWLIKAEEYCSKNKCSEEDNKIVNEKKKEYQENCSELMPPVTEEKKEQK